jgi:hypothetical protein
MRPESVPFLVHPNKLRLGAKSMAGVFPTQTGMLEPTLIVPRAGTWTEKSRRATDALHMKEILFCGAGVQDAHREFMGLHALRGNCRYECLGITSLRLISASRAWSRKQIRNAHTAARTAA